MLGTFMEVLDTSVANVALPHIGGSLSATPEEATWVLTSYLVSNAIILPTTMAHLGIRPQALPAGLHHDLYAVVGAVRRSHQPRHAHRRPRRAGRRRRRAAAHRPGHPDGELPAGPARRGDGDLLHGHHRGAHPRPDARRLHHRPVHLALGLLHQPADRPAGDAAGAFVHRGPALPGALAPAADGLPRLRVHVAGARRAA